MRSQVAKRILANTPEDVRIYTRLYADIVVRIHELMKARGLSQKALAERMDKQPSEVSKWLKGEHNFTLRSLARLQAELGEPIVTVPLHSGFQRVSGKTIQMVLTPVARPLSDDDFQPAILSSSQPTHLAS